MNPFVRSARAFKRYLYNLHYAKFIKDAIPDAGEKAVEMFTQNAGYIILTNPI